MSAFFTAIFLLLGSIAFVPTYSVGGKESSRLSGRLLGDFLKAVDSGHDFDRQMQEGGDTTTADLLEIDLGGMAGEGEEKQEDESLGEVLASLGQAGQRPLATTFSSGTTSCKVFSDLEVFPTVIVSSPENLFNMSSSDFGRCTWIVEDTKENEATLKKTLPPYDSRVFLVGGESMVKEVYSIIPTMGSIVQEVLLPSLPIWDRREDLRGINFIFGYVFAELWVEIADNGTDIRNATGSSIDLLNMLSTTMNFTIILKSAPDGQYGLPTADNNSWTGLMGMVVRKEVDGVANLMAIMDDRASVVDFSFAIHFEHSVLWVRDPGAGSKAYGYTSATTLFTMLTPNVWLCYAITFTSVLIISVLIGTGKGNRSLNTAFSTLGLILSQGASDKTFQLSTRILFFTSLAFGFITLNVFSARLASTLSVVIVNRQIKSIGDLLLYNDYNLYTRGGSNYEDYLERFYPKLWETKTSQSAKYHPNNDLQLEHNFMQSDLDMGAALMTYQGMVTPWIAKDISVGCSLYKVPTDFRVLGGLVVQKKWPFLEALNFNLLKMLESGLIRYFVIIGVKSSNPTFVHAGNFTPTGSQQVLKKFAEQPAIAIATTLMGSPQSTWSLCPFSSFFF